MSYCPNGASDRLLVFVDEDEQGTFDGTETEVDIPAPTCPPWCNYEGGAGEAFGVVEWCHSSHGWQVQAARLVTDVPETGPRSWAWPQPEHVWINAVLVQQRPMGGGAVRQLGPAVVLDMDAGEGVTFDPQTAMRVGAALIRAGREARGGAR